MSTTRDEDAARNEDAARVGRHVAQENNVPETYVKRLTLDYRLQLIAQSQRDASRAYATSKLRFKPDKFLRREV